MSTFDPSRMVVCDCTQMPEAGPCEHNRSEFEAWFTQFREQHGWQADEVKTWLKAAWDAAAAAAEPRFYWDLSSRGEDA